MSNIDKIRQEIERLKGYISVTHFAEELLSFIDSLPEQPSGDLENAAKNYTDSSEWLIGENLEHLDNAFIAGAKWQAEQLLKGSPMPEDTVIFQKGIEEGKRLMMEDAEECDLYYDGDFLAIDLNMAALGYSERDKVKIVIVPIKEDKE